MEAIGSGLINRTLRRAGLAAVLAVGAVAVGSSADDKVGFPGACYCKVEGRVECLGEVDRSDCDRRCAEALCDDWFWLERRPCWNWGYGG